MKSISKCLNYKRELVLFKIFQSFKAVPALVHYYSLSFSRILTRKIMLPFKTSEVAKEKIKFINLNFDA